MIYKSELEFDRVACWSPDNKYLLTSGLQTKILNTENLEITTINIKNTRFYKTSNKLVKTVSFLDGDSTTIEYFLIDDTENMIAFKNLSNFIGLPKYNWDKSLALGYKGTDITLHDIEKDISISNYSDFYLLGNGTPKWSNDNNFFTIVGVTREEIDRGEKASIHIYNYKGKLITRIQPELNSNEKLLDADFHIFSLKHYFIN